MAHQINSEQKLLKVIYRKDQMPVSNDAKEDKTKVKKDINSLTYELLSLINNINYEKLSQKMSLILSL